MKTKRVGAKLSKSVLIDFWFKVYFNSPEVKKIWPASKTELKWTSPVHVLFAVPHVCQRCRLFYVNFLVICVVVVAGELSRHVPAGVMSSRNARINFSPPCPSLKRQVSQCHCTLDKSRVNNFLRQILPSLCCIYILYLQLSKHVCVFHFTAWYQVYTERCSADFCRVLLCIWGSKWWILCHSWCDLWFLETFLQHLSLEW